MGNCGEGVYPPLDQTVRSIRICSSFEAAEFMSGPSKILSKVLPCGIDMRTDNANVAPELKQLGAAGAERIPFPALLACKTSQMRLCDEAEQPDVHR
jgi:hypothetical protein